ncbi:hypothetical protein ACI797_15630 [Geodermatophilus sp. SYSU D00691]
MTSNSTRPRKPSKAAMARHLAQVQAQHEQERELSPALAQLVDDYAGAGYTAVQMAAIRPFLRTVITASTLTGAESVRKHCTHIAGLAAYAIRRGVTLEPVQVLTTAFIDEYVRRGMTAVGDSVKAERRRRLLALARTVNPGPTTPARLTPIGHSAVKPPYTPTELAVITRVCRTQPTEAKRRDLSTVVALGAGAGLDSIDLRHLYTEHIEDLGADGLQVHVQQPRPRIVPVRSRLEDRLRSAVDGRRSGELVLGDKVDRRNTAARAVENAALYNVPHIEAARLRATWLADLMTDTVPIGVLLNAAGLKSARTLVDLVPHLGPWLEHKGLTTPAVDALRGGAR